MRTENAGTQEVLGRVEGLLSQMDLDEKIHQLGSYWAREEDDPVPAPSPHDESSTAQTRDVAPMESSFARDHQSWSRAHRHGLGQLTRIFGTAPLSVGEGVRRVVRAQRDVMAGSPHGIPALVHEECLTGFTALGATVYPAAIAWGATWDPGLIEEMATAIAQDMRAVGVHQGLAPLLDVVRDYRWGRVEETCGEDPYLVGMLGTSYVRGLQAGGVMATLKHFVAYPASRGGRNHAPVPMGTRELEDMMLPPFEMAVREGGARSVMNSYTDIDGVPVAASHRLLTEVLRERWGFEGLVVSDYWAVSFLETTHRTARNRTEAAAQALTAGLDVELPELGCYAELGQALAQGLVSSQDIDRAVARILAQKESLGLLEPDWDPREGLDENRDLDSQGNREIARRMAEESVILLANDGILPMAPTTRLAVLGPTSTEVRTFMGCYAFPNHVLAKQEGAGTGLSIRSLAEALTEAFDHEPVFVQGTGFTAGGDEGIAEAVAAARGADVALVTIGDIAGMFGSGTSGEGCDAEDLSLPGRQGELLDAVLATGTPTVVVLVTGRPYALGRYAHRCAAIVQAFMPGVEGAEAVVGVLDGRLNPSGRLPIAIPRGPGGQPGTYLVPPLGWLSEGISNLDPRPLFPFGAGESYTHFTYSDPSVSSPRIATDGQVEFGVTVTNDGDRGGDEVVQLYMSDPWAEVTRPMKQLIGFRRVSLAAGESARVTFDVHTDRFSFTGVDLQRIVEAGEVVLSAGHDSEHRDAQCTVTLNGERRIVPEGRVLTTPSHLEILA